MPFAFFVRRLRPVALALAIGWLALLRGGYLPYMHVLTLLPWSPLLIVGVLERVAGNGRLSRTGGSTFCSRRCGAPGCCSRSRSGWS